MGGVRTERGFSIVELLVTLVILAILSVILLSGIGRAQNAARRSSCQSQLKQISLALRMYGHESRNGLYPPLMRFTSVDMDSGGVERYVGTCALPNPPRANGNVQGTFDWPSVYPEYLPTWEVNVCPSDLDRSIPLTTGRWREDVDGDGVGDVEGAIDPCAITSESYAYFAWAIPSLNRDRPESLVPVADYIDAVSRTFNSRVHSGPEVFEGNLKGYLSGKTIYRLREGVGRYYSDDFNDPGSVSSSMFPVMMDLVSVDVAPFNHVPGGSNVLFLDGHVEFIKYPGAFPVSESFALAAEFFGA